MNTPKIVFGMIPLIFSYSLISMDHELITFKTGHANQTIETVCCLKKMAKEARKNGLSEEEKIHLNTIFDDFKIAKKGSNSASIALPRKTVKGLMVYALKDGGKIIQDKDGSSRLISNKQDKSIVLNKSLCEIASEALVHPIPENSTCIIM